MKNTFAFILILLFLGNTPNSSLAEKPADNKEISFVREIFNFHVVVPGVLRGSQPREASLKLLRDYCGVKTILDLRNDKENIEWERQVVENLGMDFINIPMSGNQKQEAEKIEQCLNIMADKSRQPVFVHCQAGKDRTGLITAAYKIKYINWSLEDALFEMLAYGYSRSCCFKLEESLLEWNLKRKEKLLKP